MIDPEPCDCARPYTCRGCGTSMPTHGRDGYCAGCSVPEVYCGGYESASGARIRCDRLIQAGHGERIEGQCMTCASLQELAWQMRRAREGRALDRARRRGYGPAPDDLDVFDGMRGDE